MGVEDPIELLNGTDVLPVGASGTMQLVVELVADRTIDESFELAAGEASDEMALQ